MLMALSLSCIFKILFKTRLARKCQYQSGAALTAVSHGAFVAVTQGSIVGYVERTEGYLFRALGPRRHQ